MGKFASETSVSSEKSRAEIESTLRRYGADSFGYMAAKDRAVIMFEAAGRRIRFELPMPDPKARKFMVTPGRNLPRSPAQQLEAWEQACRQKWRALALCVKAKLEAVECGIATFEGEFLAYILLPDGRTVGESAAPAIAQAYDSGKMPPLLGKF